MTEPMLWVALIGVVSLVLVRSYRNELRFRALIRALDRLAPGGGEQEK